MRAKRACLGLSFEMLDQVGQKVELVDRDFITLGGCPLPGYTAKIGPEGWEKCWPTLRDAWISLMLGGREEGSKG